MAGEELNDGGEVKSIDAKAREYANNNSRTVNDAHECDSTWEDLYQAFLAGYAARPVEADFRFGIDDPETIILSGGKRGDE